MVQKETSIAQSNYQRGLDEGLPIPSHLTTGTVRSWSDFSRVFYHPRSIVQINDYELGSTLMPFERWESGEELFAGMDKEHDLLDRDVRLWVEECDHMQGIQTFAGGDDAWGGFGAKYVERLRDEFGKMAIWVWGVEEDQSKGQRVSCTVAGGVSSVAWMKWSNENFQAAQLLRRVNAARSIYEISTQASIYIPISIPPVLPQCVRLDRNSQWHTSALLLTALETLTLPSRLRHINGNNATFNVMEAALNVNGNQRIANLQSSVVDPSVLKFEKSVSVKGSHDRRIPGANTSEVKEDLKMTTTNLDMDFLNEGYSTSVTLPSHRRETAHTFGEVETLRGEFKVDGEDDKEDVGFTRKRRRLANLQLLEKSVSPHWNLHVDWLLEAFWLAECMYFLWADYRLL